MAGRLPGPRLEAGNDYTERGDPVSAIDLCLCQFIREVGQKLNLIDQILGTSNIKNPLWPSTVTSPFPQILPLLYELVFPCPVLLPTFSFSRIHFLALHFGLWAFFPGGIK